MSHEDARSYTPAGRDGSAGPVSAAIHFDGVVKRYGALKALAGLDLNVRRGEIYGLLGPNGSGKSTAIKILMGLEQATSGSVHALGRPAPSRRLLRDVGYMPQETALYEDLTLMENMELFGALYGLGRREIRTRADTVLGLVDLAERRTSVVRTLSGGMKHRASLAAALLHEPDLLVLDEPTVGVDPELRAGFWGSFRDMRTDGRTVLITTHYMDEAHQCDRVGLLRHGKLIAEGTVQEVLAEAGADDLEEAFLKIAGRARVEVDA